MPAANGTECGGPNADQPLFELSPMKESKYVKTKIVTGYILLLAVCLVSVGYLYRVVVRPPDGAGTYAALRSKRDVAAQTLYHLYQAEGYAQLMIAGYSSYEARYRGELRTVRNFLDSLRALERDTLQMQRLDSITLLVADKERRTMNLWRSLRSGGTARLLNKNIEAIIHPVQIDSLVSADSLPAASQPVVREQADTVRVQRARRRFFRRIADVFSPPKEDSSIVISRTRTVADSLPRQSPVADTIASVLRSLQDRVTGQRIEIYDRAWNEGLRLSYSNRMVNRQIYRLLSDFQREDDAFLLHRIEANDRLRRQSSETLGWIAGCAVVLMLLFVAILWRDVNRSNRYKRQLEDANREKQALLDARERLMMAITHDIKAPLGSLMGYIDLLSRIASDKRQALYLDHMRQTSEHLLALVRSLLDCYRLDLNKVEKACVPFVPQQLFESIRAGFEPLAAERGIDLVLKVEESARAEVAGDPSRIRQIAENLVSNAIKFTDHGSVTVGVQRAEQGELLFEVKDTGRGIPREEQEQIFGEFVRLRSAQGVEGVGLGLSIVKRLVQLLGGRIWIDSAPGAGSRFVVSIPVADVAAVGGRDGEGDSSEPVWHGDTEAGSGAEVRGIGPRKAAGLAGVKILLVDDDPLQLEMTAALCRAEGIEAECCPYPEYAVKLVEERPFDAVLTDIQMPAMDGVQLCRALARVAPQVPVVAVSARSEEWPDGFAGVLRKPFAASELRNVLARVVRHAPGGGELPHAAGGDGGGIAAACHVERDGAESRGAEGTVGRGADDSASFGFEALAAFAAGDAVAERNILESFITQHAEAADRLEKALADGDRETIRALAHRMAPIFTMLGARTLAAALREVERGGMEAEPEAGAELKQRVAWIVENVRRCVAEAQKKVSL